MTIFRAPVFVEMPQCIGLLTMLLFTAVSLAASLGPSRAAEESPPPAGVLQMQKELVATLGFRLDRMKEERRVGQRTDLEVIFAMEDYYKELETACVMEARALAKTRVTEAKILQVRVEAVSTASEMFNAMPQACKTVSMSGR